MKKFNNYEEAKKRAQSTSAQLPEGAYVCKIMNLKYENGTGGNSDFIRLQFDVVEGEFKDFFRHAYDENKSEDKKWKGTATIFIPNDDGSENDKWTQTAFARWTTAFEESNAGYVWDWDENKWKDKLIGIVYGSVGAKIDGKDITFTEARFPASVGDVRSGKVKIPKFKARKGYGGSQPAPANADGFMTVPKGEEEIPF